MKNTRQVQRLVNGKWLNTKFESLKEGDIIRFFEPNGEIIKNTYGEKFKVLSEPYKRNIDNKLTIDCVPIKRSD